MNVVVLQGSLSRAPVARDLPSGDHVVAYEVTTRGDAATAESVPVSWFGAPAKAVDLAAGTDVFVTGRVRRRFYRANGVTSSRTEVVATAVVPLTRRQRVAKLLDAAIATLVAHEDA